MKILQIGAPKCGNLWLYNIVRGILIRTGRDRPGFIEQQPIYPIARTWDLNYPEQARIDMIDITDLQVSYRISSIYRMPVENMKEYTSGTGHVWTHSPICRVSGDVFRHFDKKLYILRDPRDRAISAARYYCSPYMLKYYPQPEQNPGKYLEKHFDDLMKEWVWHVFDHLRFRRKYDLKILFYESFLASFQEELAGLLEYLEVGMTAEERVQLEEEVSFETMKKSNPKHLKKGTRGYWKNQLSAEQKEKAERIAGPLLKRLGYRDLEATGEFRPSREFDFDFEDLKQELISSQQLS